MWGVGSIMCSLDGMVLSYLYRGAFTSGRYPEAELLYNKAIEVKPEGVLYANRSAGTLYHLYDLK